MGIQKKMPHELHIRWIGEEMQDMGLRKKWLELQASRDRYADLYEFAPVGYFTICRKGNILASNRTGAEMLEVGRADLIGKPFSHFATPDTRDTWLLHLQKIFDTKIRQSCQIRMAKKDGREFHARLDSVISPYKKENSEKFETVVTDINDLKQTEAEVREAEKKLRHEQKMKAIGTFAGGISHHFNNILSIIIGNTELAMAEISGWNPMNGFLRKISTWNSIHGFLEEIMEASLRAKEMVRQLISFTFSPNMKCHPLRIESAVTESLDFLQELLPPNIELCRHLENDTEPVVSEPSLIHLIVINLGSNAIHAMESCGGTLTFTLSNIAVSENMPYCLQRLKPGPYVKLSVADTGTGMAPEIMDRIFDPCFTTKDIGKGTGLGLNIVHGIVQKQKGGISVCSEPGSGSEFSVYFPAARI